MTRVRPRPATRPAQAAAFTFLEILVVMAIAAVLLGLGIGFLTNVGRAGLAQQAAEVVAESGRRCLNMSAGGRRATLELRRVDVEGEPRLEVQTAVQRTVLTSNFEQDPEFFVNANEPSVASVTGNVRTDPSGKDGACAMFGSGSVLDYGTRSAFAMTDGVEVAAWVFPGAGSGATMPVLKSSDGPDVWQVVLTPASGRSGGFDLRFEVLEVAADAGPEAAGTKRTFSSTPGVVTAGVWSKVRVAYDGRACVLEVNGFDRAKPEPEGKVRKPQRIWVPPSGTTRLATGPGYVGGLDTLTVAGVFRNDEDVRRLPLGVELLRPAPPLRLTFWNGRLDPTAHKSDVEVRLQGPNDVASGGAMLIRFGLYGSLTSPTYAIGTPTAPAGGAK